MRSVKGESESNDEAAIDINNVNTASWPLLLISQVLEGFLEFE